MKARLSLLIPKNLLSIAPSFLHSSLKRPASSFLLPSPRFSSLCFASLHALQCLRQLQCRRQTAQAADLSRPAIRRPQAAFVLTPVTRSEISESRDRTFPHIPRRDLVHEATILVDGWIVRHSRNTTSSWRREVYSRLPAGDIDASHGYPGHLQGPMLRIYDLP